ncbi:unnamed protein product, partial [Mesorhabditis belari]|uniref:Uncharacterized protein n=1 Tax=Mesorhabditis belari TaxID=2138241 RepID=A0AAF3F6X8_9BILA
MASSSLSSDTWCPTLLDSSFGKHPLLLWPLENESCLIFEKARDLANGKISSYRCKGCYDEKRKNKALPQVPLVKYERQEGKLLNNPEEPANPHFCTPLRIATWYSKGVLRLVKAELHAAPVAGPSIARQVAKRKLNEIFELIDGEETKLKSELLNTLDGVNPDSRRRFFSRANNRGAMAVDLDLDQINDEIK